MSSSSPLGQDVHRSGMLRDRSDFRVGVLELLGKGADDDDENEASAGEA
jgi:hypothetical protein